MNSLISPHMEVSIIIVNYNTKDLLGNCIDSIKANTIGSTYEIIVVDNNSHDGSIEMLRSVYPDVRVIESPSNLGFGKANNLGMQHAVGNYFFLLNSDTILLNDAVSEFHRKAIELKERYGHIGALGTILMGKDMTPCHSFGKFLTPSYELKETIAKYLRFLQDSELLRPTMVNGTKEVEYVTGADMFVPREAFEATGGFDPDFFMYCEDVDWQKRMKDKGYVSLIVDGPQIIHLEGGSDKGEKKTWSFSRLTNSEKSRLLYRKKHYNRWILPWFRILHTILKLPLYITLSMIKKDTQYLNLLSYS